MMSILGTRLLLITHVRWNENMENIGPGANSQ